ncbi:hypothetical protein B0H11DRAFT_1950258 [Mycena galericulata]|nr:hypothetical protein B0H11DRAFT_1950258 [Mycena galericulata]
MQKLHLLALLTVLYTSARVNAQLRDWSCTCENDGTVDESLMASCCSDDNLGNIDGSNCHIVSGQVANEGTTAIFIQCCLDNGQGAECTPLDA